jgi:hypothetical protein
MNTAIRAELPSQLLAEAQAFVKQGAARDLDALLAEALRRYLESHRCALSEKFLRDDVDWGLHGQG